MTRVNVRRVLQREDVPNTLGHLLVMPAAACAGRSLVRGGALTLGTAGVESSFRIYSRDAYENDNERSFPLLPHARRFSVHVQGAGKAFHWNSEVQTLVNHQGSSVTHFTGTISQSYSVSVSLERLLLAHSPHSLLIKPAPFCATQSTVDGAGISMASVAPRTSSLVIQARDSFGNARTSSAHVLNGHGFHARIFRSNQPITYLPPFPPTTLPTSPDARVVLPTAAVEWSSEVPDGDAPSRLPGLYSLLSEPWDRSVTASLHVSWAQKGGLHATYYTMEEEGGAVQAPCESTLLPRSHVQLALPMANGTHPGAAHVELQVALASCLPEPSAAINSSVIIRYHGMLAACETAAALCAGGGGGFFERNFNWTLAPSDRVKLWVDNALIIDQWTSLAATSATASHRFFERTSSLDIAAYFQRTLARSTNTAAQNKEEANAKMHLHDDGSLSNSSSPSSTLIPTTRLLHLADLSHSPFSLVLPP